MHFNNLNLNRRGDYRDGHGWNVTAMRAKRTVSFRNAFSTRGLARQPVQDFERRFDEVDEWF